MAKKEGVKIPGATIVRLFKSAGAQRVSGDVPEAVNKIVMAIAKAAVASAKTAGRKTVSAEDLKLVVVS
ncbi:MAG: NFYB/HAP3 family transcription factor subunit [Candidatus Hadarchaeales archaeon]